ncbi:aminoglycoside phosphotransferase [Achaetomium macrosporum]|uniref:Aminoglycoside phosphotransferase n=1 Tax=Achaetomium macrosporum TaxID=79813 RepID=A0AAN7C344_9PEZI|nr:aminoglycoside phosphotransferase [Achaetomium macrosporum]
MSALPFGLLLKWSDGTSLDEVNATRAVRAAGIPAPKVVMYGIHRDKPWASVSILMTRLRGLELGDVQEFLEDEQKQAIERELGIILDTMRSWPNPYGESRICSISGGAIRSVRMPNHTVGPYDSEEEFTAYLLSAASSHSFNSKEESEQTLAAGRRMEELKHRIVFSHGEFYIHNILVHEGHVSGLIDWETAGWYPEYWEFTTPLRWASLLPEWRGLLLRLGGHNYARELEAEQAIRKLTVDSWIW